MRALGRIRRVVILVLAIALGAVIHAGQAGRGSAPARTFEGGYLNPVTVVGEVKKQGVHHLVPNLTLGQLVDAAGGLTTRANGVAVIVHFSTDPPLAPLTRAELVSLTRPGAPLPSNVTVRRIPLDGRLALNSPIRLEPQDVLFVPSRAEARSDQAPGH
jgi:hypothetical protein